MIYWRRIYSRCLIYLKHLTSLKASNEILRKELFLINILYTDIFSKMPIQNKVISLAKMISLFKKDYGYTPKLMMRALNRLNRRLNEQVAKQAE
jgi:hypothetical protein